MRLLRQWRLLFCRLTCIFLLKVRESSSKAYACWLRRLFAADFGARLARDLSQVVSQPIFGVAWLVEALRHEGFDSILCGWSTERSDAGVPSGAEFDIRRQA